MRKALVLLIPLMLTGLILYAVWEPVSEPTMLGQNTGLGARDLEDITSQEPIAEGDRKPLQARTEETEIPGLLTPEQYEEVHGQLVRRHARSVRMIAILHEVIEEARSELIRKQEFARLQTQYIVEIKYRLAITKLENGQFEKASRSSSFSSGLMALNTGGASLILTFDAYSILFEFRPGEFPGLFALMDQEELAQDAILQFRCDEFNRLSFHDRETRIESHLLASEMLRVLQPDYMNSEARKNLQRRVLPSFMMIDQSTYTVRPR